MGRLQNLRTLSLYQNQLTDLDGIGNLHTLVHLEEINLGKNELSALPAEFSSLTQIKVLWLEDNLFDHFPEQLLGLVYLEGLRLSNNQIAEIPADISKLAKLQTLALGASPFQLICLAPQLSNIRLVLPDNNRIKELPPQIGDLAALRTLQIR